ncbi:MAG: FkbM family methyltransferase [bacterium]
MAYPDELIWAHQINEIFCDDCYRVGTLPPVCRVIDGGANIGSFSLFVKWLRPLAHIIAIEPSASNRAYLQRNLTDNRAQGIEMLPVALGAAAGEAWISGVTSDGLRTGSQGSERVKVVNLGDIIREPVDLLKLDIEGAELDVLCGAGKALAMVKRAVIEYHHRNGQLLQVPELLTVLRDQGFTRFQITDMRDFPTRKPEANIHCGLIHAWRV